jgi:hypothetical protein
LVVAEFNNLTCGACIVVVFFALQNPFLQTLTASPAFAEFVAIPKYLHIGVDDVIDVILIRLSMSNATGCPFDIVSFAVYFSVSPKTKSVDFAVSPFKSVKSISPPPPPPFTKGSPLIVVISISPAKMVFVPSVERFCILLFITGILFNSWSTLEKFSVCKSPAKMDFV